MFRLFALTLLTVVGCSNAGEELVVITQSRSSVELVVILDRDGTGTFTPPDTVLGGAQVSLRSPSGGQAIQTKTTGPGGIAAFQNVPVGDYIITVDAATIGDSIVTGVPAPVRITASYDPQNTPPVQVFTGYRQAFIRQVRSLPQGQRVLIRGLVLAGVLSFRDTTAYVADSSSQIRLTRAILAGNVSGNNPGDTVVVVGTVSSRAGQPTLDLAVITQIGFRLPPFPILLTTSQAAGASGGVLDAALVQISGVISEAGNEGLDYRVVGDDGSGPLTVVLDALGGFNRAAFVPGKTMSVRGVLVPDGTGKWRLKPRNPFDTSVF
jgi:hypothetical protein